MDDALQSASSKQQLCDLLVQRHLIKDSAYAEVLGQLRDYEYVDLSDYLVDITAASLLSPEQSRRLLAIPIQRDGDQLLVAMADPTDYQAVDDIGMYTHLPVRPLVAAKSAILAAIDRYHHIDSADEYVVAATDQADEDSDQVELVVDEGPIVKLVDTLIEAAVAARASDVHFEPGAAELRVRYRVDGVLHDANRFPGRDLQKRILARVKVLGGMDVTDRRTPQDGRAVVNVAGRTADLRISALPTPHGDQIAIRILEQTSTLLGLADLGFSPHNLERYRHAYEGHGTILVTGPTGSGKSTTLYATLNLVNDPGVKIITVEDPIEYQLPGITQVQVNPKAGLTFASALRSILRSDPDIILVGEIRDTETAQIAVQAATSGHSVLSTLHTTDAASTPGRLIDMGLEPFLISAVLECVVAQRLARRLCEKCKRPYYPSREQLGPYWPYERLGHPDEIYEAVGCAHCKGTGYNGRYAIHEVMIVNEEIRHLIVERASAHVIKEAAIKAEMWTLQETAMEGVAAGHTTLVEVKRVAS